MILLKELARLKDINVTDVIQIKDDYIPSQIEQLYRIAQDTYQRTRGKNTAYGRERHPFFRGIH